MKKFIFTIFVFAMVMTGLMFAYGVNADDTGWVNPTLSGSGGGDEWINPDNAFVSDDQYSTITTGATIKSQTWHNFDFGIPDGATIDGVEVRCEAKADGNAPIKYSMFLNSRMGNAEQDTTWTTSETYYILGGATDLWGGTITEDDLALGQSYTTISTRDPMAERTWSLDELSMKVYYTPLVVDVYGCMDIEANNYNSEATIDDGSCEYDEELGLISSVVSTSFSDVAGIMAYPDGIVNGLSSIWALLLGLPAGIWVVSKAIGIFRG